MKLCSFLLFSLLFAGYVSSIPFDQDNGDESVSVWELKRSKKFLTETKTKIQFVGAGEHSVRSAQEALDKLILMTQAAINLYEIEEKFSKINQATAPIQSIDDRIQRSSNNVNVKTASQTVLEAREQIKEMNYQLKSQAKDLALTSKQLVTVIQNNLFDPSVFIGFLTSNYEFKLILGGHSEAIPHGLNRLVQVPFMQIIEYLWKADIAVGVIKSELPSEAAQMKKTLNKIEAQFYALLKETKQSIELFNTQFGVNANQPTPEAPNTAEVREENVKDTIVRLASILETRQFLDVLEQMVEKVQEKDPQETQFGLFVAEASASFNEMKEWLQTVVKKIQLEAQHESNNEAPEAEEDSSDEGIDILKGLGLFIKGMLGGIDEAHSKLTEVATVDDELYAEVFGRVLKAKIMDFMAKMSYAGQHMEYVLRSFSNSLSDEENQAFNAMGEEVANMEPIKSFMIEAAQYFTEYLAFTEQDANQMDM